MHRMHDRKPLVLSVVGTRPEVIKMAPLVRLLRSHPDLESRLCVTGQHRELLDQALSWFDLEPDEALRVMVPNQSLAGLTARVLEGMDRVMAGCNPACVLVQGDTTTALSAALAAFYRRVAVGHVEAGLRTGDLTQPFPEEMNRRVIDGLATWCFAPTEQARANLRQEGIADRVVHVTGNTVVDAALGIAQRLPSSDGLLGLPADRRWVLVTTHRRESFGEPLREIVLAVRDLARRFSGRVHFILPVHPNPNVSSAVRELLDSEPACSIVSPLDYPVLLQVLRRAALVLTDSGGIQEEAPSFGVPVLVMRRVTERPEGVTAGFARVVGVERRAIVAASIEALESPPALHGPNPYGDGRAAARIVDILACDVGGQRAIAAESTALP
jgi:UDP-N-acetylglucosamine 2-epimerase (non-hydrolysing)